MFESLIPTIAIFILLDLENQLIGYLLCIEFDQPW
jgi:hypothetical protein